MNEPRISLEETRHVARLSKLHFEEAELKSLNAEMEAILETVSLLQRVPVEGLEATLGVGAYANRFREDKVLPTMASTDAMANAPAQRDGCFEIVRILSKTSEE
jgi:aspartyl-tRNA(Asn)/glutamyl-tRNA(Gln) amidotransferase subunit C